MRSARALIAASKASRVTVSATRAVFTSASGWPVASPDLADRFERESEGADAREELIASTNGGLERGAFGAPTFFVGDEMFWGKDRLDFLELELSRSPR